MRPVTTTRGSEVTIDARPLPASILVARWRCDYAVPYTLSNGIAEKLPNATLRIFERSGHHPFVEEPEAFSAGVTDWIGGLR